MGGMDTADAAVPVQVQSSATHDEEDDEDFPTQTSAPLQPYQYGEGCQDADVTVRGEDAAEFGEEEAGGRVEMEDAEPQEEDAGGGLEMEDAEPQELSPGQYGHNNKLRTPHYTRPQRRHAQKKATPHKKNKRNHKKKRTPANIVASMSLNSTTLSLNSTTFIPM